MPNPFFFEVTISLAFRTTTISIFFVASVFSLSAQEKFTPIVETVIDVKRNDTVPAAFLLLAETNEFIRKNDLQNEILVDLVEPFEQDKPLSKRKQWHRVGPLVIPLLMGGYNWRAVYMDRQKFVGTAKGKFGMSHKEHLSEYDITFNLEASLPHYKEKYYEAVRKQVKTLKGKKAKKELASVEGVIDSMRRKHFHCELTPHRDFRPHLHQSFFPTERPTNIKEHSNFGELRPTMGVYGVIALDCNHSCHPEIHPAEWIWWLDVNPEKPDNHSKRWVAGLFHEGSNRFKQWARAPRIGTIAIPFLFRKDNVRKHLYLNPTVVGPFEPAGMQMLQLPPAANGMNFSVCNVQAGEQQIVVYNNQPLQSPAAKWWLSDVQTNDEWIWGFFNVAISTKKVFTFKLEQSPAN